MFKRLIILLTIFILIFSIFTSKSYADVCSTIYSVNIINIDNFAKVDNYYYRGAQPGLDDYFSLAYLGVKTIINLRENYGSGLEKQKFLANSLGMNYINIPMNPAVPPDNKQISYFFNIISNQNNLPVYVHCAQGRDRTGIMTALYRVNKYGWNFDQAYIEMKQRGYHSIIFPRQKKFLAEYTSKVHISLK